MTNKIIIDAWNVIWKIPEISELIPEELQLARQRFNQLLKNYFQQKSVIYKIIYDGQPGIISSQSEHRGQDVYFSKNPESADQKIIQLLKNQKEQSQWTVITSDRELSGKIKNYGAKIVSSESFIQKLNKRLPPSSLNPKKENPNISPDEMDFWLDLFNSDDNLKNS